MDRLALTALLAGTACASQAPQTTVDEGFPRDSLVVAVPTEPETLIPMLARRHTDSSIMAATHLAMVDFEFDCELKPRPGVAEAWGWNKGGTVLWMDLRRDLAWEDGTPLTARDVAFSTGAARDPATGSPRRGYLDDMVPDAGPKVVDDHRIEWHFTHAFDRGLQLVQASAFEPLPWHILKDVPHKDLVSHPYNDDPVVSGRWDVAAREAGERLVLEANPNWSGPPEERPKLKRVVFRFLPEYGTRLAELRSGGVDLLDGIQVADADQLATTNPEIRLHRRGWRIVRYVAWNRHDPEDYARRVKGGLPPVDADPHPLFGDRRVRRALTKAIDIDRIVGDLLTSETTGEAYGRPAMGTFTPALCHSYNEDIQRLPFDTAAAAAELGGAGWEDSDGDGVLDKDGLDFRFPLMINAGNSEVEKAAVLIQANLKAVGVQVDLQPVDPAAASKLRREHQYDAAIIGLAGGLFQDPSPVWHSDSFERFNFVGYADPEVDALIDKGLSTLDSDEANATWREVQRMIYEDQPATFLYWSADIVGIHERFEDPEIGVLSPVGHLYRWWVPADKVRYAR